MIFNKRKKISILTIADTHNQIKLLEYKYFPIQKKYDICILLGDISKEDLKIILKYIPINKIVGILGNHDEKNLLKENNITDINNKVFVFNNINFFGLEGCIKYKENQIGYTIEESREILSKFKNIDILISHEPPKENNFGSCHQGNPEITKFAIKTKIPFIICGHLHRDEISSIKKTKIIKTYMIKIIKLAI